MAFYNYTRAIDSVNSHQLCAEVETALGKIIMASFEGQAVDGRMRYKNDGSADNLSFEFDVALSGGEETTLTNTVNAHVADPSYDTVEMPGPPTVNDDASKGYTVFDQWKHNGEIYICIDNTVGAAVWSSKTATNHSELNLDDGTNPHGTTKGDVGLGNVPNVDATLRSNHTGTQLASTISDFDSAVSSNSAVQANTAKVSFPEAPNDGQEYVRKNQAWAVATGGGGGGLATKAGKEVAASFAGNPKVATITFGAAFADANYSISLVCEGTNSFAPRVTNVVAGSFDINMGANNINGLVAVHWTAVKHGET
jgi:hypothetical protein